ncbi:MAG TPA: Crp/Fnr family transcriptional regulator [Terriglobales bacterium]|nr:Crp/Fnr family transcriptional regulator [Terriglobales bacterium]
MATKSRAFSGQSLRPLRAKPPTDTDGNLISSSILHSLPSTERDQVFPKLELVRLKLHQVIHEAGEIIKSGYFVNAGVMSVIVVQRDGKTIEVGLIGTEGFVGLPLLVGYRTSPTRVVTQGDGSAYRCDAGTLKELLRACPVLQEKLHRFSQQLGMQTTQIAACNRLHDVEERLARWILMTQDRIGSDQLPLTQEFLSQMLGTRRSSVTVAAGILQKAGLISYTRGKVTIKDRRKLEEAACDCYGIVQKQLRDWETETK